MRKVETGVEEPDLLLATRIHTAFCLQQLCIRAAQVF